MSQETPSPPRQSRLGPGLLLFCGALCLYLLAVSHFVVSCLDQIRQAVEITRHSYLPEVMRQQQDAVGTERLHRFATVVRHARERELRRQAMLNVQVIALNASPSRALGNGTRLRQAAQLVEQLAELHLQQDERSRHGQSQLATLALLHSPESSELRRRLDALLRDTATVRASGEGALLAVPADLAEKLAAAEANQREIRVLAEQIETVWQQCESILDGVAESMGTSACLNLDRLIGELADQVRDLQRLAVWLLSLTFAVLLVLSLAVQRHLAAALQTCAHAAGNAGELPKPPPCANSAN